MSTGDPVVSSEWVWLMKALNEWHSAWPEDKTFPIKIHNIQIFDATKNTKQGPKSHNPHLTFSTIQRDGVCLHHWPVDTHNKQKIHCASVSCLNLDHKAQGNKMKNMIFPVFFFFKLLQAWLVREQTAVLQVKLPACCLTDCALTEPGLHIVLSWNLLSWIESFPNYHFSVALK